jgi:hypothetical protein
LRLYLVTFDANDGGNAHAGTEYRNPATMTTP